MVKQLPETFPGARYCKVMQASVDSILAPMGIRRPVISRGKQFLNIDSWTGLRFGDALCDHFAKHPKRLPNREELRVILEKANSHKERNPRIIVAQMPAQTTQQTVLAIVGGGYHEAWHTKYTKRDPVTVADAHMILTEAGEILRAGASFTAKLRGLVTTLHHLIEDVRIERRGNEDFPGAIQPMCDLQDFILRLEAGVADDAFSVRGHISGNARSILLRSLRDLGFGYDTELGREALRCYKQAAPRAFALLAPGGILEPLLRVAQNLSREDTLGALRTAFQMVTVLCQASHKQAGKTSCPSCGAASESLVPSPPQDEATLPEAIRLRCSVCDHIFDTIPPDESLSLVQDEEGGAPQTEGVTPELDGFGHDARELLRTKQAPDGGLVMLVAGEILEGDGDDGCLNHSSALQLMVSSLLQHEAQDLESGERLWSPSCPSDDRAVLVEGPRESDLLLSEISAEVTYLRTRFRALFRAQEMGDVVHGVSHGRRLSERRLVDSRIELLALRPPSRPCLAVEDKIDTSLAVAVCIDQSSSMSSILRDVQRCTVLLVDPIDKVGGATLVFGFRDALEARELAESPDSGTTDYHHRRHPVVYDVFKCWDERFDSVRWKCGRIRACGGTPMADGVQYGMAALDQRTETHRLLVVLTDGCPNTPHEKVIRRQVRLAKEASIHVLGIGVGNGARYVQRLFPDHVWVPSIQELPVALLQKLQELCDFSGKRRRHRAAIDGQVPRMRT